MNFPMGLIPTCNFRTYGDYYDVGVGTRCIILRYLMKDIGAGILETTLHYTHMYISCRTCYRLDYTSALSRSEAHARALRRLELLSEDVRGLYCRL